MTHALAAEYAEQGIRCTAVRPGSVSSGMTDGTGAGRRSVGPGLPEDTDRSRSSPAPRSASTAARTSDGRP